MFFRGAKDSFRGGLYCTHFKGWSTYHSEIIVYFGAGPSETTEKKMYVFIYML
jgi:hypothetical protein